MKEGKSKMMCHLFRGLAYHFHEAADVYGSFNNSWSWNLMCRSFNVVNLHFNALGWAGDCISVQYGQDKTRKGGDKNNANAMIKHLFANPFEPAVRHPYSTPKLTPPAIFIRPRTPPPYSTLVLHPRTPPLYSTPVFQQTDLSVR